MSATHALQQSMEFKYTKYSAATAQNVWGTVLDVAGAGIIVYMAMGCDTANEDLKISMDIDGTALTDAGVTATANSDYEVQIFGDVSDDRIELTISPLNVRNRNLMLPFARSCKIEIRKTSANGAGNISCFVIWGKK